MGNDFLLILLALIIDTGSDLLLDVLSKLLERGPLVEELLCLLDLLVLADVVDLEELEGFVELVEGQHSGIVLSVDSLHAVLDSDECLHLRKILVLGLGTNLSFLHEVLHLLDFLLSVLDHSRAGQMVDVSGGGCAEGGNVR